MGGLGDVGGLGDSGGGDIESGDSSLDDERGPIFFRGDGVESIFSSSSKAPSNISCICDGSGSSETSCICDGSGDPETSTETSTPCICDGTGSSETSCICDGTGSSETSCICDGPGSPDASACSTRSRSRFLRSLFLFLF